MYVAWMMTVL